MPSCLAFKCSVTSGRDKGHRSFHKVPDPKKERARASQWINNMGNPRLNIDTFVASKSRILCSDHFHPDCFRKDLMAELMPGVSRNIFLVPGSVPTIFKHKVYDVINVDGTKDEAPHTRKLEMERMQVNVGCARFFVVIYSGSISSLSIL